MQDNKRRTYLGMVDIDYRESCHGILHLWTIECLDLYGIAKNIM